MSFEFRPMRSLIFVDCVREEYRHRLQHWLYNTHIPDSISKFTPYCVKYAFYNALPVPPGGRTFRHPPDADDRALLAHQRNAA